MWTSTLAHRATPQLNTTMGGLLQALGVHSDPKLFYASISSVRTMKQNMLLLKMGLLQECCQSGSEGSLRTGLVEIHLRASV